MAWPLRRWTLYSSLEVGGAFNHLALEPAGDGGLPLFRPQAGEHRVLYQLTLGARFTFETPVRGRK